jgi:endoglucanase
MRLSTRILLTLTVFFFVFPVFAQGFLKTNGKLIVNEKGEKVILRGMGLGGWMLQEGYMFRVPNLGQQHHIKEKISELVGEEKTNQFYEQWLSNHTTKKDIDAMASWGFNSIRLPMHYHLFTLSVDEEPVKGENTWLQKGFEITDSLLKWCSQNKMYLILDLHAAPGGQGNDLPISDRDPSKPSLWQSEANKQKMIALWRKLAEHYASSQWIGGYDIINEPNWGFEDEKDVRGTSEKKNEPLKKLMMDITDAIRAVDKKHIIIIEGNGFGNNYSGILPAWDPNMVLSFHKYGNFNTNKEIKRFLDLRDTYNVPIWLGESGENSNTWFTEAIQLAESNNIGWAWWQEKKMGINNPLEIKQPEGYDRLLNYWSGKGEKPSAEESWKILQQLLQNIKMEDNVFHRDVVDAMFRQVNSKETIPFKQHSLQKSLLIKAVDFDMGRQGFAYYDRDTASYQYTPGVNTRGNRGRAYRNDGVDIQDDKTGPYIFSIEDGEWLQYTIDAKKKGNYQLSVTIASSADSGLVSVIIDNASAINKFAVPNTNGETTWKTISIGEIFLRKGRSKVRVRADRGGFSLKELQFDFNKQ